MPSLDEGQSPREKALERIAQEIAKADQDRVPTSRQKLSQTLAAELKLPGSEANRLVDEYCDDKAPGVPFYLQDEFAKPYMKWSAIINSVLALIAAIYAANVMHNGRMSWPWFALAAVLLAFAGFSAIRAIQQHQAA